MTRILRACLWATRLPHGDLLGVYTGEHDHISVQDFGIDNVTAADGLAVGRASGFVGTAMQYLLDGYITVADEEMFRLIALLKASEGLEIEPSSAAGVPGPWRVSSNPEYLDRLGLDAAKLDRATHIVWATGGSMVPETEMNSYIEQGRSLL